MGSRYVNFVIIFSVFFCIFLYLCLAEQFNDTTIEERVAILEFQMADLTEEVTDLGEDVDVIDGEVAVILADQVIQDERILELESDSEG